MNQRPFRVCYFGTYRGEYSRNQILIKGLQRNDIEVVECNQQLWQSIEDRVNSVAGGWKRPQFWWRVLKTYGLLLQKYAKVRNQYDVLIVGYPGQFDVFLARLLSWWQGKPLVWDIFMSIYLIALERGLSRGNRAVVNLIGWIEATACRLPDRLILDTESYVQWFFKTHAISPERFRLVPTGADDDRFTACAETAQRHPAIFTVLYYGTFIPNHGVLQIIHAAKILADRHDIRFLLIGEGPELEKAQTLAHELGVENLQFEAWMEQSALWTAIEQADVCLGAFGLTPQSLMTVQNKIYEGLACGKAVITGDSPAVRAQFQHREHLLLVERNDPQSLADALLLLQQEPALQQRIAAQGHQIYLNHYTIEHLGCVYRAHLEEMLN